MHTDVMNEYVLDDATLSITDWVITFPTKRFFVNRSRLAATPVHQRADGGGACETIELHVLQPRRGTVAAAGFDFSPLPPGGPAQLAVLGVDGPVDPQRRRRTCRPTTASGVLGSVNLDQRERQLRLPERLGDPRASRAPTRHGLGIVSAAASRRTPGTTSAAGRHGCRRRRPSSACR